MARACADADASAASAFLEALCDTRDVGRPSLLEQMHRRAVDGEITIELPVPAP